MKGVEGQQVTGDRTAGARSLLLFVISSSFVQQDGRTLS
jgi:hypothetical protein